jgi:hypothetical protein
MPFWMKVLAWFGALSASMEKQAAAKRDAKLRKFSARMIWFANSYEMSIAFERVIAESEQHARELVTAQAAKDEPLIEFAFGGDPAVPPYVKDPKGALGLWEVAEIPLTDFDRDLQKKGEFGPAGAGLSQSSKAQAQRTGT